ncbi:MerR family transcriptional regulator [Amycolatopsis rhizosphaerae]|uniref:MerR family transcriptional regulator n=1 Tax=Amycolatopsis rhizosphaerae TaxID=2053003 RepID=A0A558B8A7_9PSEU|nr:MerR family transcriptional regulator [Amycolatopsis rhizosphaerae]TVT32749.1 MerR family transcriptional regulator [Amycolatopsis rhizosphaerae]
MGSDRLLTTGEAAKALSVDRSTLAHWMREGLVTPTSVTAGGHARWNLDDLRRQVLALAQQRREPPQSES